MEYNSVLMTETVKIYSAFNILEPKFSMNNPIIVNTARAYLDINMPIN